MKIQKYSKLIVVVVGLVLAKLAEHLSLPPDTITPELVSTVTQIVTAAGVYFARNKEA